METTPASTGSSRLDAIRRLRSNLNGIEIAYSTVDEFFDYMEEKYGDTFPTLSGDWGRSWEVSRLAGPWQMAEYRAIQHLLPAVESLATIASVTVGMPYPGDKLASAWGLVTLLGEHSAGPGTGWPDLVTSRQVDETNQTVLSYVISARQIVDELVAASFTAITGGHADDADAGAPVRATTMQRTAAEAGVATATTLEGRDGATGDGHRNENVDARDVWVYNSLSWPRSAVVTLQVGGLSPGQSYRVIDPATGMDLPSVKVGENLLFEGSILPPMGLARYRIERVPVEPQTASPLGASSTADSGKGALPRRIAPPDPPASDKLLIENEWYQVEIDPQSGWIVGWYDKERARQLVNPASPYRFNQLLWASHHTDFIGGTPTPMRPEVASIQRIDSPLYTGVRLRFTGATPWHSISILLPRSGKRMEIHNVLDRAQMRYVPYAQHSDHYYFAFPVALSLRQLDVRYQGATRFQSLAHDTLRGANANGIISQAAVDLRDAEWGVTVAHREAFAFSVGGIGHSSSLFLPREATLFAHVVQKADEGQTKDRGVSAFDIEPGAPDLLRFSFSFTTSDGEFDPVAATRQALQWATPPLVWTAPAAFPPPVGSPTPGGQSLLGQSMVLIDQPNVIVTALKQAERGQTGHISQDDRRELVVRLQEIAGIQSVIRLETPLPVLSVARTNAVEVELPDSRAAEVSLDHLELEPYETVTLKLRLAEL